MLVETVFRWTAGTNETQHRKGERSNKEHHVFVNPMLMFIRKKEPGCKLREDQETQNELHEVQEARNELQEGPLGPLGLVGLPWGPKRLRARLFIDSANHFGSMLGAREPQKTLKCVVHSSKTCFR